MSLINSTCPQQLPGERNISRFKTVDPEKVGRFLELSNHPFWGAYFDPHHGWKIALPKRELASSALETSLDQNPRPNPQFCWRIPQFVAV
jgi:hypothetical protein